jgi:outer membrane receptor for ferrienterochelin and colicin
VVSGELVNELPLDRVVDVLRFLPGITTNNAGELLLRGGRPGDAALYLDGVPVISGFRATPFFSLGISRMLESQLSPAPTLAESVTVETGPLSAQWGNGQAGAVSLHTRQPGTGITGSLDYETDEPFGSGHSFGLNRLQGRLEGSLGSRLGFLVGGMLEGQRSVDRGFGTEEAPIFVLAGVDTTLRVPSDFGDPFADTTSVDVYDFAVSRGSCDDFAASGNPDIARNYGFDCRAAHTPGSALSTYEVLGKLTYSFGRSRLSLLAVADQHQNRNFEYRTLYNTPGITGNRTTSSVVILGWQQPLNSSSERPLLLNTHLSFQSDRSRSGPLAPEGEESTADPFGGFLIRPLDLRFDADNFSVDDELVRNYRTNQPGSRRSPYDLENVAQYSEVDRYRNNAYGLYNRDPIAPSVFIDAGGPVGPLTLYRENRTLGTATLSWQLNASHRLQLGGEFTRYSIANYNHFLESQIFSDVYIEHPIRGALFLQDRVELGEATITGGVRYDFYDTRARRPAEFPRIATHPLFDPEDPDAFLNDDELFPRDESHSHISPHLQATFALTPQTVFRGGIATQAQAPDFRQVLRRINTDLAFTDQARTIFGSDLDFERTNTFELGVWRALTNNLSVDLAIYSRNAKSQVITELTQRLDPLSGTNRNLLFHTNNGTEKVRGVDLKIARGMGSALSGWLGYSYQDAKSEQRAGLGEELSLPTLVSRPHSVTGALALSVPAGWKRGSLSGAIFANLGVYTTFRVASGTPYTRCAGSFGDQSVLSPDLCSTITAGSLNGSRLPTFKQLDLRIMKRFGPGRRFSGYLDARNALNFKNVLAVFAVNGETSNPVEVSANWSADSADLSNEATSNGMYRPDGSINLGEGLPDPRVACATWADQTGTPSGPNCVYLIRAEERFGNGDHVFDLAEQRRASEALYRAVRGEQELTGPPRRVRLGLEVGF